MEIFQDYSAYYNLFYKDKDYRKEAEEIALLLGKHSKSGVINHIMNFGCDTGRHDLELCRMGYRCSGIDFSPGMVEIARKNAAEQGADIDFQVADIRSYKPIRKYDAVISLFHVMSYQKSNSDILAAFQSARNALSSGGIFLFDVWYGPGVLTDLPGVRVKRMENDNSIMIRMAMPEMYDSENVVDVNYEVLVINKETSETATIRETHSMRYFFTPEIQYFLQLVGFELLESLDCESLQGTGYHTWTSYYVAKAR